ncbi:hypothetical protein AAEX28_04905 [Lentisphaerota bacterium WC36G]
MDYEAYCIIDFDDNQNNFEQIVNSILNKINCKKINIIVSNKKKFSYFKNIKINLIEQKYNNKNELIILYCEKIKKNKPKNKILITNNHNDFEEIESLSLGFSHLKLDKNILKYGNKIAEDNKIFIKEECFKSILGVNNNLLKCLNFIYKFKNSKLKSLVIYGNKGTGRTFLASQTIDNNCKFNINFNTDLTNKKVNNNSIIFVKDIDKYSLEKQQDLIDFLIENDDKILKVISTATKNLFELASKDLFLLDLLELIVDCNITLPDLKDRPDDLEYIAYDILKDTIKNETNAKIELNEDALNTIRHYSWPLNFIEFKHKLKQAILLCEPALDKDQSLIYKITGAEINLDNNFLYSDLKPLGNNFKLSDELKNIEKRYIQKAFKHEHLGATIIAKMLGMSGVTALKSKCEKLNIDYSLNKENKNNQKIKNGSTNER